MAETSESQLGGLEVGRGDSNPLEGEYPRFPGWSDRNGGTYRPFVSSTLESSFNTHTGVIRSKQDAYLKSTASSGSLADSSTWSNGMVSKKQGAQIPD